jgi:DUF4097 and DUF4098 domain-containing protein YvlB
MKKEMTIAFSAMILVLAVSFSFAAGGEEVHKTFDGVKAISLKTVSGDCIIKTHRSDEVVVDLFYDVQPKDAFTYEFDERRGKLIIRERWEGRSTSGEVVWRLTVPEGAEIEFSTASGDLEATGPLGSVEASTASGDIDVDDVSGDLEISTASGDVSIANADGEKDISTASGDIHIEKSGGEVDLSTASGDIEAVGLEGELDFSTASGEIEVTGSRGIFELSCASGEVTAKGITIEGESSFSTASGDVEVILAGTSEYDLELSAASGDVTLDYNGSPVKGFFEFEARKGRGRIKSPFDFDEEEEFNKHGQTYMRKSFSMKGTTPEIRLSTASGSIVLKK